MPPIRDPLAQALAALELTPAMQAPAAAADADGYQLHLQEFDDLPGIAADDPGLLEHVKRLQWLVSEHPPTHWGSENLDAILQAVERTVTYASPIIPGKPPVLCAVTGRWGIVSGACWGALVRCQLLAELHPGMVGAAALDVAEQVGGLWMRRDRYHPHGDTLRGVWRLLRPHWVENRRLVRSWPAEEREAIRRWVEADQE